MNDSKNSSNGLLVLRYPVGLSNEQIERLTLAITPTADALGVEPMVLGNGADVTLAVDHSSLLTRLCVAVERLVAQGEPPQLSEEIAPPALNQRATGLNTRG
jgi:hypothetical protein